MVRQYIFPWNADVLARAAGQCFLDPPDYDELGKKLLNALQVGAGTKDKRFLRVTADGKPWVVRIFHMPLGNVKGSTSWLRSELPYLCTMTTNRYMSQTPM